MLLFFSEYPIIAAANSNTTTSLAPKLSSAWGGPILYFLLVCGLSILSFLKNVF